MTGRQAGLAASRRSTALPVSPIRRLMPLAEEAKARGRRVIHLNIGQPDLDPPPSVMQAAVDATGERLAYAPSRGLPSAVAAWVTYYRHHSIEVEAGDIVITGGASEALSLAMLATCDPGDEVLVPEPFYAPYQGIAGVAGLRLVPVPLGPGFTHPNPEAVRERITPATRALLICSPSNPTGTVYRREDLIALGQVARDAGLFLLSDETYREIVFDGPPAPSALSIPGLDEHVVVIDSVSKRFNACGLRIGTIVSRNPAVMAAVADLAELRLAVPVIDQLAVARALAAPEPYIGTVVATYRERVAAVVAALAEIPGVTCHRPGGGFYVVARLPVDDSERFAAWLLREFALDGDTVMVTPMSDFYLTPGRGRDEIRIACVHDPATLIRAARVIGAALAAYPGRTG
ncbi:MAG: pyridoxal phosphate-dependent aminotransferase [Sphaerobacter sp.]|nr:pyridoxal phosphate-dependent aminotransferase [Sphaerobacter sp.]